MFQNEINKGLDQKAKQRKWPLKPPTGLLEIIQHVINNNKDHTNNSETSYAQKKQSQADKIN